MSVGDKAQIAVRREITRRAQEIADAATFHRGPAPNEVIVRFPPVARLITIDVVAVPIHPAFPLDPHMVSRGELVRRGHER